MFPTESVAVLNSVGWIPLWSSHVRISLISSPTEPPGSAGTRTRIRFNAGVGCIGRPSIGPKCNIGPSFNAPMVKIDQSHRLSRGIFQPLPAVALSAASARRSSRQNMRWYRYESAQSRDRGPAARREPLCCHRRRHRALCRAGGGMQAPRDDLDAESQRP